MDKTQERKGSAYPTSSCEESTLDGATPDRNRDYAYFLPIGDTAGKDVSKKAEYSGEEEIEDLPAAKRINSTYIDHYDRAELQRIATSMSIARPSESRAEESFRILSNIATIPENDPALNPQSPSFDLTLWLKTFMRYFMAEGHANRTTGVIFKDLSVSGSGSALQLQNTIASMLLAPLRIGEFFSFGKKEHKQILRSFNGVLKSGELLVVLGRPGSGCSTLLKSMTGQLHGLQLEDKSVIHYDGIPQEKMMKEFKGEAIYNQEVSLKSLHSSKGCIHADGNIRLISTSLTSLLVKR
jgi:ATP-binding cassette subfamily G (WHITE) protein 2 (PDR)